MKKQLGGSRKRLVLFAIGGGLTVIVIAFLLVYFVIFPTSSPKPFTLSSTTSTSASSASAAGTATQASTTTGLSGQWGVVSGSQAGYRVREKLAFLPAESDAV